MAKKYHDQKIEKEIIKFLATKSLKDSLQLIAIERNISLSALLRLISSEYSMRNLKE